VNTQPAFGFKELLTHMVGDMAKAVSERPDETRQQHYARTQAAIHMIMSFLPRDVIEAMLAGRCVMLHEMIIDSVRDTLRGEVDTMRRATRSGIVAMDKAFGANLLRLEQYRARNAESAADAEPGDARAETEIGDRVRRHQFGTVSAEAQLAAGSTDPGHAAPEASPPPHIPGGDRPREASSATVAQMPGLNRQARRAISRQFRKGIDPGSPQIANASFGSATRP